MKCILCVRASFHAYVHLLVCHIDFSKTTAFIECNSLPCGTEWISQGAVGPTNLQEK